MVPARVAVIIEDDGDIRELIRAVLTQAGFEVYAAASGVEGVSTVRESNPTVVTLDLGLPDIDGFETARQIRQFSDAYIIMLTARAEELDTLLGLESGADDYITKPFRPRELRARITAMLRRPRNGQVPVVAEETEAFDREPDLEPATPSVPASSSPESAPRQSVVAAPVEEDSAYCHNGLVLNHRTRTTEVDGAPIELTRTEFDLLHALLESGRVVRSKADLVRRLRYEEYDTGSFISDADERAIEVHVGNLRRKLGDDSRSPKYLETVRGVGYRLAPNALR
ncbi:response regulator transcription factor [Arthrobacter sp. USHLN218]|uniref:response regulator transcription factor n=1 Tax=Arthrobacter sp. USHLN218 TaxID=3081232 RepID=UPI003016C2B4